jgi:hypothetical protein
MGIINVTKIDETARASFAHNEVFVEASFQQLCW